MTSKGQSPVRDLGTVIVSVLGLVFVTIRLLVKSRRMCMTVGRAEVGLLLVVYMLVLLFQIFSIGVAPKSKKFMMWISAFHLGAIVCFFWVLICKILIMFQLIEDGTKYTVKFILGTCVVWMTGVVLLSLDLALNITGQHHDRSPGLFFMTLIFPAACAVMYLILATILVFRRLEEYQSLVYVALAMVVFGASQALLFAASPIIERVSNKRINASMFSVLLDLVAVSCVYKFWNSITDDTWGDMVF
ncbi:hypothetical protein CPB97_007277 [Podila verticillata]|nr:hypothetical protein CPB97_007277 [Podila verticillata]